MSQRTQGLKQDYRFVLDQMLGRLAKWLRILGYDTLYFKNIEDSKLIEIASKEERILITRDTRLVKRRAISRGEVTAVLIENEILEGQLKELFKKLKVKPTYDLLAPFCVECNAKIKKVPKESIRNKVPAYIFRTHQAFGKCTKCHKYYWEGTHWDRIKEKLEKIKSS